MPRMDADYWPTMPCSRANNEAAVQDDSKPIRSMASPVPATKCAITSGWVKLVSRTFAFAVQDAERGVFGRNIDPMVGPTLMRQCTAARQAAFRERHDDSVLNHHARQYVIPLPDKPVS